MERRKKKSKYGKIRFVSSLFPSRRRFFYLFCVCVCVRVCPHRFIQILAHSSSSLKIIAAFRSFVSLVVLRSVASCAFFSLSPHWRTVKLSDIFLFSFCFWYFECEWSGARAQCTRGIQRHRRHCCVNERCHFATMDGSAQLSPIVFALCVLGASCIRDQTTERTCAIPFFLVAGALYFLLPTLQLPSDFIH